MNAIRLCLDHGFRVMAQMNVHRGNVACTLPTLRKLDGMGVYQTRVIRTSESPRWLENAPEMTLTPEEYFDHMLEVMGAYGAEQHRMALEIWQFAHLDPIGSAIRSAPSPAGTGNTRIKGTYARTSAKCPRSRPRANASHACRPPTITWPTASVWAM